MEPIFPKYSGHSVSLPVWKSNVIRFLANHKKYRIFWWEFGPTLLDHLHKMKESKHPDYTKNGLVLTYCAALITASALLTSTRRAAFTAAVTSSVMLLGITITVLVDYQNTKRKPSNEEANQEDCLKLLEALGEMPRYWWWPWSSKIKDIKITEKQADRAIDYNDYSFVSRLIYSLFTNVISHQFCVSRYGYIYNYQELTEGKMPFGVDIKKHINPDIQKKLSNNLSWLAKKLWSNQANVEDSLEVKSDNLIKIILNVNSTTLNEALSSMQFGWLLGHLDESLKSVRAGTKTKEQHDQYFKNLVRVILKLSKTYHSDKKANKRAGMDIDAEQKLINEAVETLRNVHEHVMKKHKCIYNQYYGIYELYGKMAMSALNSGKDILDLVDISSFDGGSIVLDSLHSLIYREEGHLMRGRNEYIKEAKGLIKKLRSSFDLMKDYASGKNSTDAVDAFVKMKKSEFDGHYESYKQRYYSNKVEQLEMLLDKCKKNKRLEIIKNEVEELLKESNAQYKILIGKESGIANELFVQPALSYKALAEMYCKFITQLCNEIKKGAVSDSELKQMLSKTGVDSDFIKESKKEIGKFSDAKLLNFLDEVINNYYPEGMFASKSLGRKRIAEMMSEFSDQKESDAEIINLIVFTLKLLEERLDEKFQEKETYFDREKRESEERQKRIEKLKREIEQIEEEGRQHAQRADREAKGRQEEAKGRQEAEKRAEQESQRAERLAEALRKAGIDPDTVLQGVNVSQGASTSRSAGVGRR
ncbi:coiled-coil domain-containing protein [Wolbachia endosymbiont of Folsomia candida]|uniref:hypothetical protein n=1 Tax=Wolbachia endosymbiont of Folsomia candida TaxID=169402 RepID=UPI000ACF00D4|nr:hypothetical protein [Wolbachia endosymbiont of Folsomia candida]